MRVTENTNYETIRDSIQRSKGKMENLQQQQATLRKINTPSDDPVAAAKILEIRTDKVINDQLGMNGKLAGAFLANSEQAIGDIAELVVRAKEIAIGQSSGASSNEDTRTGIAEEVSQLYQQAVSIANRKIGDRYIFGGYKTDKAPFDADGRYHGDDGQQLVEIAKDVFLAMNVPGADAFNTNPKNSNDFRGGYTRELVNRAPAAAGEGEENDQASRNPGDAERLSVGGPSQGAENVNVFDELQNLRIALVTGDLDGIHNTLERFDQLHGKLNATRAKIGSRIQGLETTSQANERHNLTNAQLSSTLEDADMAQVVSDLQKEETVFRSALQSSQKLIQPTLLEFLK